MRLEKTARLVESVSATCNFSSFALAGIVRQLHAYATVMGLLVYGDTPTFLAGINGKALRQGTCRRQSKGHLYSTGNITST